MTSNERQLISALTKMVKWYEMNPNDPDKLTSGIYAYTVAKGALANADDVDDWMCRCKSMTQSGCTCGPIAEND